LIEEVLLPILERVGLSEEVGLLIVVGAALWYTVLEFWPYILLLALIAWAVWLLKKVRKTRNHRARPQR
jgi:hypothetical protein